MLYIISPGLIYAFFLKNSLLFGTMWQVKHLHHVIYFLNQPYEKGIILLLILQMKKTTDV